LDPAIVVGHPDARFTPLPARDATLHGELERSNKYPNDSFVRNWRQTSDHLTWNVEVPVAGRFEVELYYTCPSANTGAEMELRWGDASVAATITEADAWDPPEEGAEHDRIPRQESYVKDFRPLTMGVIELAAGKGTLTLHATKLPGKGGPDFRLLNLRRVD
jgi:hypothetical protein